MEKKKTIVHFLGAIIFIVFAVMLFNVANGTISMERPKNPDGSFDYSGLLSLAIPFNLCIIALAGLITVLNEGEFHAWLVSSGVILVVAVVGFFLDIMKITGIVIAGLYSIWWMIASVRGLRATWGNGFWVDRIMAVGRFMVAVTLVFFVLTWVFIPVELGVPVDMSVASGICTWAGVLSLVSAVALFVEGVIWVKYCDY